jgi:hypothetical protein
VGGGRDLLALLAQEIAGGMGRSSGGGAGDLLMALEALPLAACVPVLPSFYGGVRARHAAHSLSTVGEGLVQELDKVVPAVESAAEWEAARLAALNGGQSGGAEVVLEACRKALGSPYAAGFLASRVVAAQKRAGGECLSAIMALNLGDTGAAGEGGGGVTGAGWRLLHEPFPLLRGVSHEHLRFRDVTAAELHPGVSIAAYVWALAAREREWMLSTQSEETREALEAAPPPSHPLLASIAWGRAGDVMALVGVGAAAARRNVQDDIDPAAGARAAPRAPLAQLDGQRLPAAGAAVVAVVHFK